jgi:hypothetical protein
VLSKDFLAATFLVLDDLLLAGEVWVLDGCQQLVLPYRAPQVRAIWLNSATDSR